MELDIVDPIQEDKEKLTVDCDLMVLKYYFQLYSIIKKLSKGQVQPISSNNYKIVYLKEENIYIGMLLDIYDYLDPIYTHLTKEDNQNEPNQQNIYLSIEQILDRWDASNRPIHVDGKSYYPRIESRKITVNCKNKDIKNDEEAVNKEIELKINEVVYENIYEDLEDISIGIDGIIAYTNLDELKEVNDVNTEITS